MDRRTAAYLAIAALILWLLWRAGRFILLGEGGGFNVLPSDEQVNELPPLKIPALPPFKSGMMRQSTGLMCHCNAAPYTSPIVVREIAIPRPPVPRYVYQPEPIQLLAQEIRTYSDFGMNDQFAQWGNRGYEQVWRGSDGRIFLRPKVNPLTLGPMPNTSNSAMFIGTDEYYMDGGDIVYGPYRYRYRSTEVSMGWT